MPVCEVCGNDYERAFTVTLEEETHIFDCFECAIHLLAPECVHCGCRILGHGTEQEGQWFCCAHCARAEAAVRRPGGRTSVA